MERFEKIYAESSRDYMLSPPYVFFPAPLSIRSIMRWIIDLNRCGSAGSVNAKVKRRMIRRMKQTMRGFRSYVPDFVTAYRIGEVILQQGPSEELDLQQRDPRTAEGFIWWKEHFDVKGTDLKELDFENPLPCIAFLDFWDRGRQEHESERWLLWYA